MDSRAFGGFRLWHRFWFDLEDPRTMGLVRIVFGTLVVCNINGLWEYFGFLFSDEGIFPADVAQEVFAKGQFRGFGDGLSPDEPRGFFDARAVVECLRGPKFSLLFFWDSPTAVWVHVAAFELCMFAMIVGWWTRTSSALGFVLMGSLFDRNPLFWEGTELVFRVFFVYLLCARSGHAWSVDNWWRCRRLRRSGVVPEVYRAIPCWPRRLMMLQLAIVYLDTGLLKSGSVWSRGDAVYYAMNLDHFYRFEPQRISALLGTNLLRVVTWFVRLGEVCFALVFVGEVLRVGLEARPAAQTRTWRTLGWIRRWILGRRIWITWAVLTMGGIFVTVNIGMFQPVMLALCLVYFRGEEFARIPGWWRRASAPTQAPAPALGTGEPAHGRPARLVISAILLWHSFAIAVWLVPERESIAEVRTVARTWVRPWLEFTRTAQGWGMFAPNPPRQNVFMQVLVTDADGEVWDMQSDVYAPQRRALPFVWNDRMRKMNRRIIGGESGPTEWYRKWYARWQCRQWALDHDGALPRSVELVKLSYSIPTPEAVRELGWYRPADRLSDHGAARSMHTERCATAVLGQPLPEVARRHGIVSAKHRPWIKRRRAAWGP